MKYLEGALYIVIGLVFFTLRTISNINMVELREAMELQSFNFETLYGLREYDIFSYSIAPYLLGILFIILGVIKIREVMKNE